MQHRFESRVDSTDPLGVTQNFSIMAKANQPNRVELLQAVTKSVNKVAFNPSKARKTEAIEAINDLWNYVRDLEQPKPKAKRKASKPKAKPEASTEMTQEHLLEMFAEFIKQQQVVEEPKPKAKSKPKAKRKAKSSTRKQTPSEMVADSDEMKRQPKAVGPIAKGKKKTANVVESAEKVESLGKRNTAAKAAKVAQKKQHGVSIPNDCAFSLNEGESPQDAVRRRAIEDAKRKALEATLLADFNSDEVTGQIELNF